MDTITATNHPSGLASANNESRSSAVSWAAVFGGAFVAAALSVVLLALGAGLGLSSVSPWSDAGVSAASVGAAAIFWLILMQIIASSMGGYLAGRLRTKWVSVHNDEVFFRDTAHGFLVWAVGLVMVGSFLASTAASLAGGAAQVAGPALTAAGAAAGGAAPAATNPGESRNAYFVDTLMRADNPAAAGTAGGAASADAPSRAEAGRIFANALQRDTIAAPDRTYLAKLIAAKTGLDQAQAEQRVDTVIAQARNAELEAKQAADTARKAAAHLSLWMFLSFLIGAFCASYAATIGGRQRDTLAF